MNNTIKNWNCKVRPLARDMYEYVDWSMYNFETTKERWDIIVNSMLKEEINSFWKVVKNRTPHWNNLTKEEKKKWLEEDD